MKTLGAGLVGGTVLTGSVTARGNVVSQINRNGHYAWFPLAQENWGRQKHPYDFRDGDSRWMAEPASGGGVRALAKNIGTEGPPNRNTGFDIHMGPLGNLESITVTSRTVQTQKGADARLFIGLYLDENKNGEFFHWETVQGNRESALPGIAGDEEGLLQITAGGTFTISDTTTFLLLQRGFSPATFGDLKAGEIDGIDAETPAALYVGVIDKEEGGVEEVVVEDVTIQKG
ncbi:hypothetical protein ACH9L7_02265 [Haloferax sp. S1W]|uniref:hypothetical protein n=1 Tax=Haloferax sp. S1W TaxID=3377110 RepID=UPI0037CCB2ED